MSHNDAYFIAAQSGITPVGVGYPGSAKTATIQAFARAVGRKCYTLIGSLRDPADIGGYPTLDKRVTVNGETVFMRLAAPEYAVNCLDGSKWVLFIDELTTVPPAVQAALLRVIAERVVGDLPLPSDTWILGAANPPTIAANGFELEPPMANRVCHLQWKMDWDAWDSGLMAGLDFPAPKFPVLPEGWENGLSGTAALVAAFRKRKPSAFEPDVDNSGNLKMDRAKMSGPWPSPRSWTMAIRALAAAESVKADNGVQFDLVAGCVGDGAAKEFAEWRDKLDLPDPEEMIEGAIKARKKKTAIPYTHPNRPDKTIAVLGSVASAVLRNTTPERWEAGMLLINEAAKYELDVACVCAKPLATLAVSRKDIQVPPEVISTLFGPLMRAMGK